VLIGSNGSGKSTFLKLLAGTLNRDAGSIRLSGQAIEISGEVLQAAQALEEKKAQAFVKIGDYATVQDFDSIAKVGLANEIPVISFDADDIKIPGTLATPGWSY
jgi:ABC-type cobalamin/Fe3+-siderophores transport system ATPase subunit